MDIAIVIGLLVFYLVSSVLLLIALPALGFVLSAAQFAHLALMSGVSLQGFLQYAKAALILLSMNQVLLILGIVVDVAAGSYFGRDSSTRAQILSFAMLLLAGIGISMFLYLRVFLKLYR